jgi:hypothetical protein
MAAVLSIPTRLTRIAVSLCRWRAGRATGGPGVGLGTHPGPFHLGGASSLAAARLLPDEQHLPDRGTNRGAAYDGPAISGEEHEVVLREGGRWPNRWPCRSRVSASAPRRTPTIKTVVSEVCKEETEVDTDARISANARRCCTAHRRGMAQLGGCRPDSGRTALGLSAKSAGVSLEPFSTVELPDDTLIAGCRSDLCLSWLRRVVGQRPGRTIDRAVRVR